MPFLLFRALEGTQEIVESILAVPQCMRDDFSTRFLAVNNTVQKLLAPEAQAVLEAMALMADIDVAAIESMHSQLRELSLQRARGHTAPLTEVSARYLIRWVATRHGAPPPADRQESQQKAPKRTRSTSAWNAFQASRFKGQRFNKDSVRAARAEYQGLNSDELEAWKGEAVRRTLQRQLEKNVPLAEVVVAFQQSSTEMLQQHSLIAALPGGTYLDRLQRFNKQIVVEAREQRKRSKDASQDLVAPTKDVSQADPVLARALFNHGGDGLLDGLRCVPAPNLPGQRHVDQVFWQMPLASFAQAQIKAMIFFIAFRSRSHGP